MTIPRDGTKYDRTITGMPARGRQALSIIYSGGLRPGSSDYIQDAPRTRNMPTFLTLTPLATRYVSARGPGCAAQRANLA